MPGQGAILPAEGTKMTRDMREMPSGHGIVDSYGYFALYDKVLRELPYAAVELVAEKLIAAYEAGQGVFIFGNGGSAALASHFACDLGKGTAMLGNPQRRFKALSLTDNMPLLTAWANDTSYDNVFAEQLRNIAQAGDVVFAISASGNSRNVLLGLESARKVGACTLGLAGFNGGKMKALCDLCIVIPSNNMQIVEDFQLSVSHALFVLLCHRIQTRAPRHRSVAVGAA
jgi:D-sedoheptulose 7-phosphate isomerase